MAKTKLKKKEKKSVKEIMDLIIDKDELKKPKKQTEEDNSNNEQLTNGNVKVEFLSKKHTIKWYDEPMVKSKFIVKEIKGKFYAQYEDWKNKHVWVGPYETNEEVSKLINDYCRETKKNPLYRNIPNIKSIIME